MSVYRGHLLVREEVVIAVLRVIFEGVIPAKTTKQHIDKKKEKKNGMMK